MSKANDKVSLWFIVLWYFGAPYLTLMSVHHLTRGFVPADDWAIAAAIWLYIFFAGLPEVPKSLRPPR